MSLADPPAAGEWRALLERTTCPVSELARSDVPEQPGVYLWRRDGLVQYVGKATSLRSRLWGSHLGRGVTLSGSSLRRNVCELLFGIPPAVTAKPDPQPVTSAQAEAIAAWLRGCELSWLECETIAAAGELEDRLRRAWLPPLNRM
ncbi:MAG: hypothetical protein KF727_15205 [Microbacteriaceae bacterium]|nr:hypothetical protein [Microbacteriaceae bacterium]